MHVIARMNIGGPAREISNLLTQLDSSEFHQTLITGNCTADEEDYLTHAPTQSEVITLDGFGRRIGLWTDVKSLARLAWLIRQMAPDVVHTHTTKAGVLGRLAALLSLRHPQVVHTYHGHLLSGYFSPLKTWFYIRIESALSRMSDALVTVGKAIEEELISAGIGRRDQYRTIQTELCLREIPDKLESRLRLEIPADAFVVSTVGRVTKIKRLDRVVDAARRLGPRYPKLMFVIVGGGEQEAALRKMIADENLPIRMLGWRLDIECILGASDLVLLTSDSEGAPLSLIEAALAGVPVVSTNVGSVSEIVVNGKTGWLCKKNTDDICNALEDLITDDAKRIAFGSRARAQTRLECMNNNFVSKHGELYRALAKKNEL